MNCKSSDKCLNGFVLDRSRGWCVCWGCTEPDKIPESYNHYPIHPSQVEMFAPKPEKSPNLENIPGEE